jgi:ABC-type transport system involved in multi-copper enzyme maturation permease subunit
MGLSGAVTVLRFELLRTLTVSRITGWFVLVLFPVFIVSVITYYTADYQDHADVRPWGMVMFGLIPEVICLLGLLLWATPIVHTELEGRTWIYLAVRPRGRINVLLGKYLAAVLWTASAAWTSAILCVLIARPEMALRLLWCLSALVGFSCLAYGALYCLIGAFFHRRAMVIAVAYTLVFEFLVSLIPAMINKFTVQYRLRCLLVNWMEWSTERFPEGFELLLGDEPSWLHVLILIGIIVGLLVAGTQVIQHREYATAEE